MNKQRFIDSNFRICFAVAFFSAAVVCFVQAASKEDDRKQAIANCRADWSDCEDACTKKRQSGAKGPEWFPRCLQQCRDDWDSCCKKIDQIGGVATGTPPPKATPPPGPTAASSVTPPPNATPPPGQTNTKRKIPVKIKPPASPSPTPSHPVLYSKPKTSPSPKPTPKQSPKQSSHGKDHH
jgi:hypothetical protein